MSTLAVFATAALACAAPAQDAAPAQVPVERVLSAIDAASERGARWLAARQRADGSFAATGNDGLCSVALSAMALWSLGEARPQALDDERARAGVRYLVEHRCEDGGIYDPARGLAVYTTGVSVRALRALGERAGDASLIGLVRDAELFDYRRAAPESVIDAVQRDQVAVGQSAEVARKLLAQGGVLSEQQRKALEFLAGSKRDAVRSPSRVRTPGERPSPSGIGPFTYDDLLPFVYLDLSPEHTVAVRALHALRSYYTVDHNPDLTKRYGQDGFLPGTQGLYYYYLVVARALSTQGHAVIETADGARHEWAREIALRLVQLQDADGSWVNRDPRWWEHEPVLVTSYALLTLARCRATIAAAAGR